MIVIGGLVLGAVLGAISASRRGGKTADILLWAAVWGIAFALAGLFATLVLDRLLRG